MNIDRTGQPGAGPSSLPDAGNAEESSAALARNRSASGMQAKPPLQRVRKSGRPLPDAAIRQAAAPAEERKFGFTDLPIELMFKIRSKLGQGDAARLVETSKSMNEVFTPRVKADYLQYLARHPENSPHPSNTPAERVTYFVDLIRQTQEVPEELRAPVLQDVLVHAYEHCLADDGGFEHVAAAYLKSTDFILDRRARFALLCHFGEMLESAGFRQRFVDRNGPHRPRPDVMELARHFHKRCWLLMNEPRRPEKYPIAGIATPTDLDKDTSARARWAEHVAMHPGDIHALHAIRTSSLFMYPANERLQRWRSIVQQGLWIPAHLRAPLLEKLCATTTELGSADDGLAAMAEVLEFSRSVTAPGAQAMAIGRLTDAVLGLYQPVQDEPAPAPEWRDRGLLMLLAAASKLPPEVRLSHQAPLIEAITDLGSSGRVSIFDIVLNNVSDLNSVDQGGLMAVLGEAFFDIPPGPQRLAAFDRMWQALAEIDSQCRQHARQVLVAMIPALPGDAQQYCFIRTLADVEKLPGAEFSAVVPTLVRGVRRATDAATRFCMIAAAVGRQPRELQAEQLRSLYDELTYFQPTVGRYAMLNLLNPMTTGLQDGERADLIGWAVLGAAWLPSQMLVEQIDALVTQANTLTQPMREDARMNILLALTNRLSFAAQNPAGHHAFGTIVASIGFMPLAMRVPLLATATLAAARHDDIRSNRVINDSITATASRLPFRSRMQLREYLAEVDCRHLLGFL